MKKNIRLLIISLMIVIGLYGISVSAFALDDDGGLPDVETIPATLEIETYHAAQPLDSDELLEEYIDAQLFSNNDVIVIGKVGAKLTGVNRAIYIKARQAAAEIASGQRESTSIEIPVSDFDLEKDYWTADDLGVEVIVDEDGYITDEAAEALSDLLDINLMSIIRALIYDCPFDLYWFDKVTGAEMTPFYMGATLIDDEWALRLQGSMQLNMAVAQDYSSGQYEIDLSKMERVQHAIAKIESIVDEGEDLPDYEKLDFYRSTICGLTSYDYSVAGDDYAPYGDPWQLISVFDEDNGTNVVCEGYSKAFQYLCDLSTFSGSISSITVEGIMNGGTGAGNHMWNVVNMEDGHNYLVDITNCDEGTVGDDDYLFLCGYSQGSSQNVYKITSYGLGLTYTYSELTLTEYDPEDLELYEADYPIISEKHQAENGGPFTDGDWTYSLYRGIASISAYTGQEKNVIVPSTLGGYPVSTIKVKCISGNDSIESVTISNGITTVETQGINNCGNLKEIEIPASVQLISSGAFWGLKELEKITVDPGQEHYQVINEALYDMGNMYDPSIKVVCYPPKSPQTEFTVENGTEKILQGAFQNAGNLEKIVIPEGVKLIEQSAFSGCTGLEDLYIYDSETQFDRLFIYNASGIFMHAKSGSTAEEVIKDHQYTDFFFIDIDEEPTTFSGAISSDINWEFDYNTKTLRITGRGEIPANDEPGYHSFGNSIKNLKVEEGITSISYFYNMPKLQRAELPASLKRTDYITFSGCDDLNTIVCYCNSPGRSKLLYGVDVSKISIYYDVEKEGWETDEWSGINMIPMGEHDWDDDYTIDKNPTYTEKGSKSIHCRKCKKTKDVTEIPMLERTPLGKAAVTGLAAVTYSGKALKPVPVVKVNGKTLVKDKDFTLSYKDNKNVGKATVIINGKNAYSGSVTQYFNIIPKKTTLKTLSASSKALTVKWNKQTGKMASSKITGYQIQLATNSTFTQNVKNVNVKGCTKVSKKVTKLKAKTKYFVRIRTYMVVSGATYYSSWSPVKNKKTK